MAKKKLKKPEPKKVAGWTDEAIRDQLRELGRAFHIGGVVLERLLIIMESGKSMEKKWATALVRSAWIQVDVERELRTLKRMIGSVL